MDNYTPIKNNLDELVKDYIRQHGVADFLEYVARMIREVARGCEK